MSILVNKHLDTNETIKIIIPYSINYNIINGETVSIEVVHVLDWYDDLFDITGKCIIDTEIIKINLQNNLSPGLYLILCIKNKENQVMAGKTYDSTSVLDAFTVNGTSIKSPINMYQCIVNNRNALFNIPKYDYNKEKSIPYDICVFCKNINVDVPIQYGDIEVIPYDELKSISEIKYVNSFFLMRDTF